MDEVDRLSFTRRALVGHCTAAFAAAVLGTLASQVIAQTPARQASVQPGIGAASTLQAASGSAPSRNYSSATNRILVVGDSLSAEYGLVQGTGWVSLLQQRLQRDKPGAAVVNASISGDTTSGGQARLSSLLKQYKPTLVVLELGGNDALRGLSLASMKSNLTAMAKASKDAGARVLIVGMQVPPNYGRKYSDDFAAVFGNVAREQNAALVPFLLKGVADIDQPDSMFQADRIHPLATAHPAMLENVWTVLKPLLK